MSKSGRPSRAIYWRCFHCGATFTQAQERWARQHFGDNETVLPVCQMRMPGEHHLLNVLRKAQRELEEYRSEDTELMQAIYAMKGDHAEELRREEERGYEKGLADGRDASKLESFQKRVHPWMMECFGPIISSDRIERGDRLLEEVLELLQSGGYDPARVLALRDYVWGRPVGNPNQEVGGVMVTLAAYCLAHDLDMHEAAEVELARVWTKVEQIRAKQAAKPTGSALPIAKASEVGDHD